MSAPPGLDLPSSSSSNAGDSSLETSAEMISKLVLQNTDEKLEERVEQIWNSAEANLRKFDQKQEQTTLPLQEELDALRSKVDNLEADKAELRQTCSMMQEQMAAFAAQLYGKTQYGMEKMMGSAPMEGYAPIPGVAGLAPFTGQLPAVPFFPTSAKPSLPTMDHVANDKWQNVLNACPLPPAMLSTSEPATPTLAPRAPPGLPSPPEFAPLPADNTNTVGAQPGNTARDAVHSDALRMMQEFKEKDPASATDSFFPFQSPGGPRGTPARKEPASPLPFQSPKRQTTGTPSMASPLLASALNHTPKRTPRMSFSRGTPGMKSPSVAPSPYIICESGGTVFGFTLRRAENFSLGLNISHTHCSDGLRVESVNDGGALAAWNKQCAGGPAAGKAVIAGDRIVRVNNATVPDEMLSECKESKLLKFTVVRGELDGDIDPLAVGNY